MELCHVEFCGDLDPDAKVRCLRHQKVCFFKEDTSDNSEFWLGGLLCSCMGLVVERAHFDVRQSPL